jgi:Tol biopolymer transport system component
MGPVAAMAIEQRVTDPALVPKSSAGTIALTTASWVPNQYSATLTHDVWTIQPDGSSLRQFLGPEAKANYAIFAPGGQGLYFQSTFSSNHWSIYRSPTDGSATYNLLPSAPGLGQDNAGPTFAPQSPQMLFTSTVNGTTGYVALMGLHGENPRIVNQSLGYHYMGSLNADGSKIVFSHTAQGYLLKSMNADGTNVVSLMPSLPNSYAGRYTPNGHMIVSLNQDGNLYRVNEDGTGQRQLTTGGNYYQFYITSPTGAYPTNADEQHGSTDGYSLSPNGQLIAYIKKVADVPQVFVVNIDGTNAHQITNLPWACARVQWSPQSDQLAFASFDNATGHYQLFLMDLIGGAPQQVTHFTDRSVDFISWSSVVLAPEPGTLGLLIAGSVLVAGWAGTRRLSAMRVRRQP